MPFTWKLHIFWPNSEPSATFISCVHILSREFSIKGFFKHPPQHMCKMPKLYIVYIFNIPNPPTSPQKWLLSMWWILSTTQSSQWLNCCSCRMNSPGEAVWFEQDKLGRAWTEVSGAQTALYAKGICGLPKLLFFTVKAKSHQKEKRDSSYCVELYEACVSCSWGYERCSWWGSKTLPSD